MVTELKRDEHFEFKPISQFSMSFKEDFLKDFLRWNKFELSDLEGNIKRTNIITEVLRSSCKMMESSIVTSSVPMEGELQ